MNRSFFNHLWHFKSGTDLWPLPLMSASCQDHLFPGSFWEFDPGRAVDNWWYIDDFCHVLYCWIYDLLPNWPNAMPPTSRPWTQISVWICGVWQFSTCLHRFSLQLLSGVKSLLGYVWIPLSICVLIVLYLTGIPSRVSVGMHRSSRGRLQARL